MSKKLKLVESRVFNNSPNLDKDKGIVYGAKVLGFKSAWGYEYDPQALKTAVPLYEGKPIYVNHPPRDKLGMSRNYQDRFGRLQNVRFQEGKGIVGDIKYNRSHPVARQFEDDVENDPKDMGLSQNASGSTVRRGGKLIVESIDFVRSVDLVTGPATNVGLFESKGASGMRVRRKNARPTRRQKAAMRLLESVEDRREEKRQDRRVRQLVESVLEEKLSTMGRGPEDEDDDDGDGEESPRRSKGRNLAESKLLQEVKALKHSARVRDLCEDMGFRPTRVQLKALNLLESKGEVKSLIASMRGTKPGKHKAKSSRNDESRSGKLSDRDFLESIGLEIDDPNDDE